MAIYYDIPKEAENAIQVVRDASSARNTNEFKELLLICLGGRRELLKLVIDGQVGRDYSGHTVLHRVRFDGAKPETWEAQVTQLLECVWSLPSPDSVQATSNNMECPTSEQHEEQTIGVLFDIDGLGGPSLYGHACWLILMKHLDLREMCGVNFFEGDLDIQASQRPYCYCIAVSELQILTGGRGVQYFLQRLSAATDAGLFPAGQRFVKGNAISSLLPTGHVDLDGFFRMSSALGDFGDLRLVRSGREYGWRVLPDDYLLVSFALAYADKTGKQALGIPLSQNSRDLCESILKEVGQRSVLAAIQTVRRPPEQLQEISDRLIRQLWSDSPSTSTYKITFDDLEKISDQNLLYQIILEHQEVKFQDAALRILSDESLIIKIAQNTGGWRKHRAIDKISDQRVLTEFARTSDDKYVRETAASRLYDQDVLAHLALDDPDRDVRRSALINLTMQEVLFKVAIEDKDDLIRLYASDKINDQVYLFDFIQKSNDFSAIKKAIERLTDQTKIAQVVMKSGSEHFRYAASERLTDPILLEKIAMESKEGRIREIATKKITDVTLLTKIALNDADVSTRLAALDKIDDQHVLKEIVLNDKSDRVRSNAARKLTDQETLFRVAFKDKSEEVRNIAMNNIYDQEILAKITLKEDVPVFRYIAVQRLVDQALLTEVVKREKYVAIRAIAAEKLNDHKVLAQLANDIYWKTRLIVAQRIKDYTILKKMMKEDPDPAVRAAAWRWKFFRRAPKVLKDPIEAALMHLPTDHDATFHLTKVYSPPPYTESYERKATNVTMKEVVKILKATTIFSKTVGPEDTHLKFIINPVSFSRVSRTGIDSFNITDVHEITY